ncbi:MAG TPA: adenylosuccinate lyase [Planctomycetota bacterium]|jgi:adenylosuccinate lyase|nr:adenylosuccinate lyase [Planctomycetota bacterium]OQC22206.1 MAG: Adenylosuccinate lyase [Planctomycetes bacterium ADurb.Bin069]HNS00050.1 adenylosuccinate lyase [Planctomycetota bacterium]HNU25389.1 adenylosuccinate lyase [Planctomycetota bacterium]HOE29342.1 adenylosuccinate lyase [Planctomycetota bacterium]
MADHETWEDPLAARYATAPMRRLFSERNRIRTWRAVWLALAEAQRELGLQAVTAEAIEEMRANLDRIDFAAAQAKEREIRHDVMAHVHAFGLACPHAEPVIHLGATSECVCGNADLILYRDGLALVKTRLVTVMAQLAREAEARADLVCLGYTHFQVAQPTTVGKRLALYLLDFLMDLDRIEHLERRFPARGVKGTTGTQASYLALLGDDDKVKELDRRVAAKLGFESVFPVTGQTYTRKFDVELVETLAGIGASAHKFAVDLRLLAHLKEIEEPFEKSQTGSSAMVYKRNPMRAERATSLARVLMAVPEVLRATHANQWLERTLDDSAARRLELPRAFLLADAILNLLQNITAGLVIRPEVIRARLAQYLPFLATEEILMECVRRGKSRQEMHARLKAHAREAWEALLAEGDRDRLTARIDADPEIPLRRPEIEALLGRADRFAGCAPRQTREFIAEVSKRLAPYKDLVGSLGDALNV